MTTSSFLGRERLYSVGIMTGNSMDGVDVVLTEFRKDGSIRDIASHSEPFPNGLAQSLRAFRACLNDAQFDIAAAETAFGTATGNPKSLDDAHDLYLEACALAVTKMLASASAEKGTLPVVNVVGFHGQTLGHLPPSIARTKSAPPFTIQFGDGQRLSDLLNKPVVYDFRSDDIVRGGEGAPLAPMHHSHLAADTVTRGFFPIAFINAGNTGNISVITRDVATSKTHVIGWDTGPFNHFPDLLARNELGKERDEDGFVGSTGTVNLDLLRILFNQGAITKDGANFLLQTPPRSSDPQWYRNVPELTGNREILGRIVALPDRLRTAEYFSAYLVMYSLTMLADNLEMPAHFALCGGGWKNPIPRRHFEALLSGDEDVSPVLDDHKAAFTKARKRIPSGAFRCEDSSFYGYDGTAMEARIFADAAVCRLLGLPFTNPETTAVSSPCVCGLLRFPSSGSGSEIAESMKLYGTLQSPSPNVPVRDGRFGRATPNWQTSMDVS